MKDFYLILPVDSLCLNENNSFFSTGYGVLLRIESDYRQAIETMIELSEKNNKQYCIVSPVLYSDIKVMVTTKIPKSS